VKGILFVAIELHQNTSVQQAQMRFNQNERSTEVIEELFRNADLNAAFVKFANGQTLSPEEDLALSTFAQRILQSWNWIYGEVQLKSMDDSALSSFPRVFCSYPAGGYGVLLLGHYWSAYAETMDTGFRDWMEEFVTDCE
jgi:hypothetical protein